MREFQPKGFVNRYLFQCVLGTTSSLHVGDGATVHREGLFVETQDGKKTLVDVSSIATDHEGRPYLPGRTIKGNLRSWLGQVGIVASHKALVDQVFGRGDPAPAEAGEESTAGPGDADDASGGFLGGKARFLDAFALPQQEQTLPTCPPPYWDAARMTGVSASTAIDRRTRTVRARTLFHEEYVPAGIQFQLVILAENLTDDERDLLLVALDGFSNPAFPVCLGSGRTNGRGRFAIRADSLSVRKLGLDGVQRWRSEGAAGSPVESIQRFGTAVDAVPRTEFRISPPPLIGLKLRIKVDGPFLVNDPSRAHTEDGNRGPDDFDHVYLRDEVGHALLPADSLRGALRSQAERIIRTLGQKACHVDDPEHCCSEVKHAKDVRDLCVVCRLFGGTGWASAVQFSDFAAIEDNGELTQKFVAIDRVTGGAAEHLKFKARSVVDRVLEGSLSVALDRLRPCDGEIAPLELLVLTLRDLAEGDVPLGFGAAKGYGACTAQLVGAVELTETWRSDWVRWSPALWRDPSPGATNAWYLSATPFGDWTRKAASFA